MSVTQLIEYAWWLTELLLALSLKALLLSILVWAGLTIARVRSATWAHRAWSFCLLAMLAMPLLAVLAPSIPVPGTQSLAWQAPSQQAEVASPVVPPPSPLSAPVPTSNPLPVNLPAASLPPTENLSAENTTPQIATPAIATEKSVASAPVPQPTENAPPTLNTQPRMIDWLVGLIAAIYLAGWMVMSFRLAGAVYQCRRLLQGSLPVELPATVAHLAGNTQVVQSSAITVPLCQGIWQPTILLPADWKTWDTSLLAMVLSHEAEHLRRRDPLIACLAAICTTLYWFHPTSWWLQRNLADLAEHACDDAVIGETGERNQYARILLEMATRVSQQGGRLQPLSVGMARKSEIEERVERAIDTQRPLAKRIGLQDSTILLILIGATAITTAGLTLASQALAQEETAPQDPKSIQGSILLPNGQPAVGAEVRLLTYNQAKSNYDHFTTQTDAGGKFQFIDIKPGNHRIAAFHKDMATRAKRFKQQRVAPGDQVELKLSAAPSLEVKVLQESDATPIPDARVRLTWSDLQRDHSTNAAGVAVIHGLTAEEWTFEVQAKGYGEESQTIKLSSNDSFPITVKLKPGFAAYGTVRDDQGNPVSDVGMSAFAEGLRGGQLEYTKTDAAGKFRFDYLPFRAIKLFVTKDGYEAISPVLQPNGTPMGEQLFDITLPRSPFGGSITGRVLDAQGKPIPGAKLSNHGRSSNLVRETETDAEGKYLLENLYELFGQRHVFVQAEGFAPQKLTVTPGPEDKSAVYDITLEPGRTITGTVLDDNDQPLAGVSVIYRGPIGDQLELRRATDTNGEGKFTLTSLTQLAPLTFQKPNYSTILEQDFPSDSTEPIIVRMLPAGMIRGTVVDDQTGQPITNYTIQITFSPDRKPDDANGSLSGEIASNGERVVDAKGAFEIRQLVAKMPLQVTIQADGYQKEIHTRVVAATEATAKPEVFRLKAIDRTMLKTYAGQVVDAAGKAVPGVQLRLIAANKRRSGFRNEFPFNWNMVQKGQLESMAQVSQFLTATTDNAGRFRFEEVLPSPDIEIAYWGGGVSLGRKTGIQRLDEQERANIVISTQATGSLKGLVNRDRFKEISDIRLGGQEMSYGATLSDNGTRYELNDISPGKYQIHIHGPVQESMRYGRPMRNADVIYRASVIIEPGTQKTLDLGMEETSPNQPETESMSAQPQPTPPPFDGKVPTDQIRLAGQVLTPAGEGIPQAKLWLPKSYREILVETVADDEGRFSLLVPRQAVAEDRTYSIGTLWGYAAGRQIGSISVDLQLKQDSTEPIGLILAEATDAAIYVESTSGQPVVGALVGPLNYKTEKLFDLIPVPVREQLSSVTNSDGLIQLPACSPERLRSVIVTADNFGEQHINLQMGVNAPSIETIELKPAGRVEGQLTATSNLDFTGTKVSVSPTNFGSSGSRGNAITTADTQGKFVIAELAEGEYVIHAQLPGEDNRFQARTPGPLDVDAQKTAQVTIPFEPTIEVRGKVLTQDKKQPVPGAWLIVSQGGFLNIRHAFTDNDGSYTARVLPGQNVSVQLISKPTKYMHWLEDNSTPHTSDIPLDAQEFELPPIELMPTYPTEGKLMDAYDRPIPNAEVIAIKQGRIAFQAKTDAEGKFTLHLPADFEVEEYSVTKEGPAYRITPKVASESPLVLQLP